MPEPTGPVLATFRRPDRERASETVLIDTSIRSKLDSMRFPYGSRSIEILPAGAGIPVALDELVPFGLDSPGQTIQSGVPARLNVLPERLVAMTSESQSSVLARGSVNEPAVRRRSETGPTGLVIICLHAAEAVFFAGFDRFSYILTVYSKSTFEPFAVIAEVTLTVGQVQDPLVSFDFTVVNEAGNAIRGIRVPIDPTFRRSNRCH